MVVIAAPLPEAGTVLLHELEAVQPFGAFVEVEFGDDQARGAAVFGFQFLPVVFEGDNYVVVIQHRGMLGAEVEVALRSRRQWLLEEGLAHEQGGRIVYARNLLQALQRRELAEVSARVTRETGLDYAETKPGDWITGNYRRMLTLHSGRFALIERAGDFSLVP